MEAALAEVGERWGLSRSVLLDILKKYKKRNR
jgi:hypothetical protein